MNSVNIIDVNTAMLNHLQLEKMLTVSAILGVMLNTLKLFKIRPSHIGQALQCAFNVFKHQVLKHSQPPDYSTTRFSNIRFSNKALWCDLKR